MKNVSNQNEALSCISEIQKILRKKDWRLSVGFAFEINKYGKFILTAKSKYYFSLTDNTNKNKEPEDIFCGNNIEEATNKFINFFLNGGKGEIQVDEDGYQFHAKFHYDGKWILDSSNSQSYNYRDSDD